MPFCFGIVKTEKQIQSEYGTDLPRFVKRVGLLRRVSLFAYIFLSARALDMDSGKPV